MAADQSLVSTAQAASLVARVRYDTDPVFAARVDAARELSEAVPGTPQTDDVGGAILMATAITLHMADTGVLTVPAHLEAAVRAAAAEGGADGE